MVEPASSSACARARRSSATAAWAPSSPAPSPRLRCPEEANLRAPESVVALHASFIRAGADLIETNTFGANRRKLAARLPRGRVRADQLDRASGSRGRRARSPAATSSSRARSARSATRALRRRRARRRSSPSRRDPRGARRRPAHARDVLRPRGARRGDRGRARRLAAPARRADDLRRRRPDARRRLARDAAARLDALDLAAIGANHSAGPAAALNALAQMQRRRAGARRAAERRPRQPRRLARDLPARDAGVLREFAAQARRLGAGLIGGCCGTTPAQIAAIRAAVDEGPRAVARRSSSASASSSRASEDRHEETQLARMLREGEFVVSVQLDPPLGG